MPNIDKRLDELQTRLDNLLKSQETFQRDISQIRYEMNALRADHQKENTQTTVKIQEGPESHEASPPPVEQQSNRQWDSAKSTDQQKTPPKHEPEIFTPSQPRRKFTERSNLERFIGENLISKIGIVILVIGVAIGAKYAIDNNLISPLMRIVLGYAIGIGLVGLAVKLKAKYHNFSAILLSGGMAIMYFITLFAYSFYSLISQTTAFASMVIFTIFTVASALNYDRQVIAHIGLVGAYAIPFLLSDGSGNYTFLFSYIAILNIGILSISLIKYWKPLFYSSYVVTWLTFHGWYVFEYSSDLHFGLALFFLTVFFLIFYLTFVAYKAVSKKNIAIENVSLILMNAFIFYGLGYSILEGRDGFEEYLGVFTVGNAAIHFVFAFVIGRLKLATLDLVYLTAALVLTFLTIAVPVQLEGNFITLTWTAEAAILFWIGRTKQLPLFEYYSYPLMFISAISLLNDWATVYVESFESNEALYPIFNRYFAVGIFFVAAFTFISLLNRRKEFDSALQEDLFKITTFIISAVLLFALYNIFRIEIGNYFNYKSVNAALSSPQENFYFSKTAVDFVSFNIVWQINYTMLFLTILSFINVEKFKDLALGLVNLLLNALSVAVFVTVGLFALEFLRESYLQPSDAGTLNPGIFHILIRYVSYAFFAAISFATYKYSKQEFLTKSIPAPVVSVLFDSGFYFSILIVVSVELTAWLDIFNFSESSKLGLSILWGIYALFLIVLGIIYKKLHLRIFAISLLALTMIKLFVYDIANLDTISKTVVFISLGVLLLIVSFLYTKYKNFIFDEEVKNS